MPRRVLSLLLIQIAKIHASDNLESKRKGVRSENSGSKFFTVPYSKKFYRNPVIESPKKKSRMHRILPSPGVWGLEIKNKSPLRSR